MLLLEGFFSIFSQLSAIAASYREHLLFLLIGFAIVFLFFIQSGESPYKPTRLKFIS